jgi:N-acetylmuramoyl-L-alanine amidase
MKTLKVLSAVMSVSTIVLAGYAAVAQVIEHKEKEIFLEKQKQIECLAMNIYHEARSEPTIGKIAVAWVTVNRVNTERYPDTVCGVVYDAVLDSNGNPKRHQCQFSWYCDGKSDDIKNKDAWYEAVQIATLVYYSKRFDPTEGAIMYHANYVSPNWKSDFEKTVRIDEHIFYK